MKKNNLKQGDYGIYMEAAKEAVIAAGGIIRDMYKSGLKSSRKKDGSLLTGADLRAEEKIKKILLGRFSHHGFRGEESEEIKSSGKYVWICDPIDSTTGFTNGETTFATNLALSRKGKIVVGVVYNPITRELFTASEGLVTKFDNSELPIFNRTNLRKAVINYQIYHSRIKDVGRLYSLWGSGEIGKIISRGGSPSYNLAQVARGGDSAYVVSGGRPPEEWDIAAGTFLVKSVGGRVSMKNNGCILIASTNPEIHRKLLKILDEVHFGR